MRLYLKTTESKKEVPINYQSLLTSAIHRWIGRDNTEHGKTSEFSFSWLKNIEISKDNKSINCTNNSYWYITAHNTNLIKKIIEFIQLDNFLCDGTKISEVMIDNNLKTNSTNIYNLGSPILLKLSNKIENKIEHLKYDDERCTEVMTRNMKKRMIESKMDPNGINISFNLERPNSKVKVIDYKGIKNKVNFCPINIIGNDEQIRFIKCVGVGHSTGIGFGAIE